MRVDSASPTLVSLSARRRIYGFTVAVLGPPLLVCCLLAVSPKLGLDTVLPLFLLLTVIASVVGGVATAMVASVVGFGLANFFFTPPYGTFIVASAAEVLDLLVFLAVAVLVGLLVEIGARTRQRDERNRVQAEWLAGLDAQQGDAGSLDSVLAEVMRTYAASRVSLNRGEACLAAIGTVEAGEKLLSADAGEGLELQLAAPERIGADLAPLKALALTAGRLWRTQLLAQRANRAEELARIDELRASLLAAVGHDLRSPIAAIRAAAATLAEPSIELTADEQTELLAGLDDNAQRLNAIIANLLDLTRLQAGALSVQLAPTSLLEVMSEVIRLGADRVVLEVPEELPLLLADAGLLERVLANLVDNAIKHQGSGQPVLITAVAKAGQAQIRVIDHGRGVDPDRFEEIFRPFQHFGDRSNAGVGLGLAIARGFAEAMDGQLLPTQTAGGGLTMTLTLGVADGPLADC